jgi:hypothetical protein
MTNVSRGLGIVLAEDVPAIAKTRPPGNSIWSDLKNFSWLNLSLSLVAWDKLCPEYEAFLPEVITS